MANMYLQVQYAAMELLALVKTVVMVTFGVQGQAGMWLKKIL